MRMLSTMALAASAFAAFALSAAESDYSSMSKLVPARASSLMYVKPSAFAGHPMIKAIVDATDSPDDVANGILCGVSATANSIDGAIIFADITPPSEYGAAIVCTATPMDLAVLKSIIPGIWKVELGKFGDEDALMISGKDSASAANRLVVVMLEPGLFVAFPDSVDGKAVLADVRAKQGVNAKLAAQVVEVEDCEIFAAVNIPANATPVFEQLTVSIKKTGNDGLLLKLHTVVHEDLVTDTEFAVTPAQLSAYIAKLKAWDKAMDAKYKAVGGEDGEQVFEATEAEEIGGGADESAPAGQDQTQTKEKEEVK